ncbi:MAG: cobalamin-independent methionine synthase II family protein [Alphaproteobacteria bacterium]|nr:cobalamin-independent methionine synthase II family protein [Alphaproteobacteria bacterium]
MKTSTDRILTTHTGSLPRPKSLIDIILGREKGDTIDPGTFEAATARAIEDVVGQQVACGIDIVSDGEMSKPSYATYVRHRIDNIVPDERAAEKGRDYMIGRDLIAHPDFGQNRRSFSAVAFPGCVGPLKYKGEAALKRDLADLKAAVAKSKPAEAFMTAPSPGILTRFVVNLHYPTEDAYVDALAEAMKVEYRAIVEAGFILQVDCPDLGSCRNNMYRRLTDDEFRSQIAERNIAALNGAIAGLPADRMRLHICWGNYEGPHTHDLPLTRIIDIAFKANMQAFSIEAANPRHDHEWEDLKTVKIPDEKILIPGVIDSTTNFVEHPKLVAQRIGRYADIVGRERVIAGVDCGFGTAVRTEPIVADSIVWSKLKALSEGAAIASGRLWGKAA